MHLLTLRPLFCQQFLNRLHDPEPHGLSLHVAGLHKLVGPHGGVDRGVLTVLLDEFVGGAVDRQGRQIAYSNKACHRQDLNAKFG